jgi:hypothetical protein
MTARTRVRDCGHTPTPAHIHTHTPTHTSDTRKASECVQQLEDERKRVYKCWVSRAVRDTCLRRLRVCEPINYEHTHNQTC